jgi:hypothetical protein
MLRSILNWVRPGRALSIAMILGVFAPILAGLFLLQDVDVAGSGGSRGVLKVFEGLGLAIALWRANRSRPPAKGWNAAMPLWAGAAALAAFAVWMAVAPSLILEIAAVLGLSAYLFLRDPKDRSSRAAAAVILAVGTQSLFAPLIYNALSPMLLPIDAALGGAVVGWLVPGATVDGTIIATPSGHSIIVLAGCSTAHNLSLAILCWVAVTMATRPWWTPKDLVVGAVSVIVQVACNFARLVLVAMSAPLYEFWHAGAGGHVFALCAVALAIALSLVGAAWASRGVVDPLGRGRSPAFSR